MFLGLRGLLTRSQSMGLAAAALGLSVFFSRILGLVRDKVISYYFGAGVESDLYFIAFVAPDFLNYLLAGGYFSITLVPMLAQAFAADEADGWRFFSAAVCWSALAIGLLTLIVWIFAPQAAALLAPRFSVAEQARLAYFLRILLPAQVFFLPGACFAAVLYYRRQFAVPALTPLIYNGCTILGGILFFYMIPGNPGMDGFCWGVLAGAALGSFALPVLAVRAGGLRFSPRFSHPAMKRLLLLMLPLMLGQSIVALDEQFVRFFGGLAGPGEASLLNYARRIMLVPVGVVAQAAGLASYPFLALLAASGEREKFDSTLNSSVSNTLLVALPLSLCMLVLAEPTMRLIFQQGGFDAPAAARSGPLLAIMLGAVAFWAVQQIVGRAFYACQDTITPALAGTLGTVLALPLYWVGATRFGAAGVAMAGSFGVVFYTLALCLVWRRRFGPAGLAGLFRKGLTCLVFCLPACAAAWAAAQAAGGFFPPASLAGAAARLLSGGAAFALFYIGLTRLFAPWISAPVTDFSARIRARFSRARTGE